MQGLHTNVGSWGICRAYVGVTVPCILGFTADRRLKRRARTSRVGLFGVVEGLWFRISKIRVWLWGSP